MPNAGHSRTAAITAGLLLASVAGCAATTPAGEFLTIRGSLTYLARIALPPDSQSVVELRDAGIPDGPVIAEQRTDLAGAQVPVPFELTVTRARLDDSSTHVFRGAIATGGRASWVSAPLTIDTSRQVVDLGLVLLTPYTALAFVTHWTCGGQSVALGYAGDQATLQVGGDNIPVQPVPSASGVRYDAVTEPDTFLWSKGDRAILEVRGRKYPECIHVVAPRP
jgi:uncharacterized lipoprotein YbaY